MFQTPAAFPHGGKHTTPRGAAASDDGAVDDFVHALVRKHNITEGRIHGPSMRESSNFLKPQERAYDAMYKERTGEDFRTVVFDGQKGLPKWGGHGISLVDRDHPALACAEQVGFRAIVKTKDGFRLAYPEGFACGDDNEGSDESKFERSLALLQTFHTYTHALNALKRAIVADKVITALDKLFTPRWFDSIATKCLNAIMTRKDEEPFPSDLPISPPMFRQSWLKVALHKGDGTIPANILDDEGKKRAVEDSQVYGGWRGCIQLSPMFARLVLDAVLTSVYQYIDDWFAAMDPSLFESTSEVILIRQKVLLSLTESIAETIKDSRAADKTLAEIVAALKLTEDNTFFPITAESADAAQAAKANDEAKEWATKFEGHAKKAVELNLKYRGSANYRERKEKCEGDENLMLEGTNEATAICLPREFRRLLPTMGKHAKTASVEQKARNALFVRYIHLLAEGLKGDAEDENAVVKQVLTKVDPADISASLVRTATRSPKKK